MPAARLPALPNQVAAEENTSSSSPYQRLVHALHHDSKWQSEVSLGKRIGFYRIRGDLGSGNFSQVKMAVHQLTRERVAIKILDKSKLDQKTRRMLAREIATMETIHHPNIIRLYEVVETYSRLHLVLEYASGGELFNRISSAGRLSEDEVKPIFAQVVAAVSYMHENNFIHRDIKAENVFYTSSGLVKLGDFGFSTQVASGREQHLTTFCGSPPYAAPELFRDESYVGTPVDVWALGVLLFFMVSGQMPFKAHTVNALKKVIIECSYTVPAHVSPSCKAVIEAILQVQPSRRPPVEAIKETEFLSKTPMPPSPGPSERYSITPTHSDSDEAISEVEASALEKLAELGITRQLLDEHRDRGAKSAVIGTYRILIHRLQRSEGAAQDVESLDSASLHSGHYFSRLRSMPIRARKASSTSRSRTCSLL